MNEGRIYGPGGRLDEMLLLCIERLETSAVFAVVSKLERGLGWCALGDVVEMDHTLFRAFRMEEIA